MAHTKITGLLLSVLAVMSAGCQSKPPLALVEGTVTQGGKPLAGVIVDFYPDSGILGPRSTSAPTDEAGHYRLRSTGGGEDGVVVGPHRVCILDSRARGRLAPRPRPKNTTNNREIPEQREQFNKEVLVPSRVPPGYSSFADTPLRVEVRPGSQVIDFEVK